jgi:hypothetical protein
MSTFSLTFRVDSPTAPADGTWTVTSEESEALRQRLYASLGVKPRSGSWVTVVPGTRKGDAVLRALATEREAGRAVVGAATLAEAHGRLEVDAAPWFLLGTRTVDDFNLWDAYPSCRAGTLPKVHALNHTFVSSAFVTVCREHRLRGVSFLRCGSRGRKAGDPWFVALPDDALGRGLDHSWFDRARWLADVRHRPARRSSAIAIGQWSFHQCWLRDAAASEAPLCDVLVVCPTPPEYTPLGGLTVVTIPRFWRNALPDADFAYLPWGEDGPNREGKILRFRNLYISARGRRALIEAGLFPEKMFFPIRVVDHPEPGVALLDSAANPLTPMYTPDELAVLRAQERALGPQGHV